MTNMQPNSWSIWRLCVRTQCVLLGKRQVSVSVALISCSALTYKLQHLLYLRNLWVCSCDSRNSLPAAAVSTNLLTRGTKSPKHHVFIMVHWNAIHFAKSKAWTCSVSGEFWNCVPCPTRTFWQGQASLIPLHLFERKSTWSILPCASTGGQEMPN